MEGTPKDHQISSKNTHR